MSFLAFSETPTSPDRKTKVWIVLNAREGIELGRIRFTGAWRKFVFYPKVETQFDSECLLEIAAFLSERSREWRLKV